MPGTEPQEQSTQETMTGRTRRPALRVIRITAIVMGIALGIILVAIATLLLVSVLVRSDPAAHMPDGFNAYASVPNAGTLLKDALDVKALDAILSNPGLGSARALVRSLRSAPFLRSKIFDRLAGVRLDAAIYEGDEFLAVASLGYRSAALRLLPLLARIAPGRLAKVPGFSFEAKREPARFELLAGETTLYLERYKDLLIVSSSEELFKKALDGRSDGVDPALKTALKSPGSGSLRVLVDPVLALSGIVRDGPLDPLLGMMNFPALAVLDLSLADERITVSLALPAETEDPNLSALLGRRSRTPSILSRLPESASYFSLLSAGRPGELWTALSPALGAELASSYKKADDASRAAWGLGLEDLLFSWMGDEMGVYGSSLGTDPVFFSSIADEKARRIAFDTVFDSPLVSRDTSALVGKARIPRIVFPRFLRAFLSSLGIRLVEPFYLVEDGFLYASSSAELLSACVEEARAARLLVKTDDWKEGSRGVSPESSVSIFYSLDRSAPFFVRGSSGLASALRLYGRGVASIRLSNGSIRLELSAVPIKGAASLSLPGFPVAAGGRMNSDPIVGRAKAAPMAYWTSASRIMGIDLSSGARYEAVMDEAGWVTLDMSDDEIDVVWAISERGTVYAFDAQLAVIEGFPLVTGQRVSGPPAVSAGRLIVPVSSEPALMFVAKDASIRFSDTFAAKSRTRPAVSSYALAALPRSFDSELYLMDLAGSVLPGWPVLLPTIASAAPIFAGADTVEGMLTAITEAGSLLVYRPDAQAAPGFPLELVGSFDAEPVWAPGWRSFFVLSVEGRLSRIGIDGSIIAQTDMRRGSARGGSIVAFDADGDGREELYVSGGGDALYAFSGDLYPLPGYPVPGSGSPAFIDIDADGRLDLVERGADDTIRAYAGR
ncbi:MAG: hypothetical protein RBT62_03665 [Spirochaetia bacterium]|nr:hypothetical protein [Spirochaetia bacterium]